MPPRSPSPQVETTSSDVAEQLDRLNQELESIGDILDGIRTDISWGLQNGRVILSLADMQELQHVADATLGSGAVQLTLRLQTALATFGSDLSAAVDRCSRATDEPPSFSASETDAGCESPPVLERGTGVEFMLDGFRYAGRFVRTAPSTGRAEVRMHPEGRLVTVDHSLLTVLPNDLVLDGESSLPLLTLFNPGDAVEFELEGEELFGEIVEVDDARNSAMVMLIPSGDEVTVCQDDLHKVEPDDLSYGDEAPVTIGDRSSINEASATLPSNARSNGALTIVTPTVPEQLAAICRFLGQLVAGEVTPAELRTEFERFVGARESFVTSLVDAYNAGELRTLAHRFGDDTQDKRRQFVATRVYEALLRRFACDQYISPSVHGTMLPLLVSHNIDRLTPERLENYARSCAANREGDVPVVRPNPTLF